MERLREGGFLISKIKQISGRIFNKKLRSYDINDLNGAQGRIIFSLWQNDNIPISELARQTALGKTTLTSMLDRLEAMGYIKRHRSKEDRRKILIQRTSKDKNLESKYVELSGEITRLFYKGFSKSRIDRFEKDLVKILENLTDYEAEMQE